MQQFLQKRELKWEDPYSGIAVGQIATPVFRSS
jgi:hypothetical protein